MAYESSRRALRGAVLPILVGLLLMVAGVGIFAAGGELGPAALAAGVVGALGSGVMLIGALKLARASVDGRPSAWLLAFFALWLAELVLRLWTLAGAAEDPLRLRAVRLLLAAAAMACLASGVRRIWREGRTWTATRWLFALQFAGALCVVATGVPVLDGSLASQTFQTAVWLAFALPYAHAILSIRRTVRWLSSDDTVAGILTSP